MTFPFEFSFSPFCPVCLTSNLWLHGSEVGKLWHNGSEPTEKFSRIHNLQCNLTFTEIFCSSFSQNVTITFQFQINFLASRSNKQTNCLQLHSNSVSHLHIKRGCDRITCSVTIGKTKYPSTNFATWLFIYFQISTWGIYYRLLVNLWAHVVKLLENNTYHKGAWVFKLINMLIFLDLFKYVCEKQQTCLSIPLESWTWHLLRNETHMSEPRYRI